MADRETREFTTPGGHKVVLRTYLTGQEDNELTSVLYGDLKMSVEDMQKGIASVKDVPGTFIVKQEEKAVELLVVSVDGINDNAAQTVLNLPMLEYKAIVAEINNIRNPTTPEKSEQPGADTSQTA
jgi:hypothetical protein